MIQNILKKDSSRSLAGLLLILGMVIFCVWPGMTAPLFTDDIYQLEWVGHFTKWTDVFRTDVFVFYRPIKNALFALAAPYSAQLFLWHWVGLAAYLAACVGIFRIVSICLESRRAALLATCLWALSPSCVSTAIWVSCANISIGLVFAAGVFHFHEIWATKNSCKALVGCVLCYIISLHCYEAMIAIPGVLFIRDLQERRLAFDRRSVIRYGTYTLVAIAYLLLRHFISAKDIGLQRPHPGFSPDTTPLRLCLSAPWFLWRHFLMWIFPFGKIELLGSYAWMRSASAASLIFGWLFLIGMLASAAVCWKRYPKIAYGLLFFVIASLPAGNFLPNFNGPINDAYVTIPSIGLAIAGAMICEALLQQFLKRRREAASGSIAIMAILSLLLIYRLPVCGAYFRYWAGVWTTPTEMMLLTCETRPFQFQPKAYVSILLFTQGIIEPAEAFANEVIEEAPWNATARLSLARIAEYHQDSEAAEKNYQFVLNSPEGMLLKRPALYELGKILMSKPTRREEAAQLFRRYLATAKTKRHPEVIALLAKIYTDQGNSTKARTTLERGIHEYPNEELLVKTLQVIGSPSTKVDAQ